MWWVVGGLLIVAAAVRWVAGRYHPDAPLDQPEKVRLAYARLRRERPMAIAAGLDGPVLFKGKVSANGEPLVTPISQRPCVFFELRIDDLAHLEAVTSSRAPTGSTAVLHERRALPFLVTDDTGTAEVRLDNVLAASFVVQPHLCLQGRRLRAAAAVTSTLVKMGMPPSGALVVTESAIFLGDTVTVTGVGTHEAAPGAESAGYRELPMRCVVRPGTNSALAILKD